jgi:hypothetical protein
MTTSPTPNRTINGLEPSQAPLPVMLNPPFGSCPNRMHDTPSAAACIGLAPATMEVERCRKRLKIAHHKIGRKVVYRESDLIAFLDSCRVEG